MDKENYQRKWIYNGPELDDLISDIDLKKSNNPCAIIMPVFDEVDLLQKHLNILEKQTTKCFDVIIPHSLSFSISDIKKNYSFNIFFLKENRPLGVSAGLYAGQKYAIENNYTTIILADVDCFPVSKNLIEELILATRSDTKSVHIPNQAQWDNKLRAMHWYASMDRSILEASGLTYAPFYYGNEDGELALRIKQSGFSFKSLGHVAVNHDLRKIFNPPCKRFFRLLYYLRNYVVASLFYPVLFLPVIHYACPFAFFDNFSQCFNMLRSLWSVFLDILSLKMFKNKSFEQSLSFPYNEVESSPVLSSGRKTKVLIMEGHLNRDTHAKLLENLDSSNTNYKVIKFNSFISNLMFFFEVFSASLRKENLVMTMRPYMSFNPFGLLARNLFYYDGESMYALSRESNIFARAGKCFVSLFLYSSIILSCMFLSLFAKLRLGRTFDHYGLFPYK